MTIVVSGTTFLQSADGKYYGKYPNGDAPVSDNSGTINYTLENIVGNINGVVNGGGFVDGQSYTIVGTGFGTKPTPEPLVYDNFEAGVLSSNIAGQAPTERAIGGSWVWGRDFGGPDNYQPTYSNTVTRANSTKSAFFRFEGAQYNNSLEIIHELLNTGDKVYFSYWEYYEITSVNYSRNRKPWVVYGNTGYYPTAYIGVGDPNDSDGWYRNSVQDPGINEGTLWGDISISGLNGEWVRHEYHLIQSGNNANDGYWGHTVHRSNTPSIIINEDEHNYTTRASSDYWRRWNFGSYQDNDSTNASANIYLDNIYFDSTPQRVELGDAPTWGACTKRELQIAKSWSDTSITININTGPFSNGDTVYLYVVGDDGNVINTNGFMVTVG